MSFDLREGDTITHNKRGTEYVVLHLGVLQCSTHRGFDDVEVVVYGGPEHAEVWVRPLSEFAGRFTIERSKDATSE